MFVLCNICFKNKAILFVLIREMGTNLVDLDEEYICKLLFDEYASLSKDISARKEMDDLEMKDLTMEMVKKWVKHRKYRLELENQKKMF